MKVKYNVEIEKRDNGHKKYAQAVEKLMKNDDAYNACLDFENKNEAFRACQAVRMYIKRYGVPAVAALRGSKLYIIKEG